jgi:hypothetical protein
MQILSLFTAAMWVDFAVIVLSKFVPLTKALGTWYAQFGPVAAASDVLIIVLGVLLAQLLYPGISGWALVAVAVAIQLVHDVLFYLLVIQPLPPGQNRIIDLFKQYAAEGSWKILLSDSAMMVATVLGAEALENSYSQEGIQFGGVLATYSLLYMVYTK